MSEPRQADYFYKVLAAWMLQYESIYRALFHLAGSRFSVLVALDGTKSHVPFHYLQNFLCFKSTSTSHAIAIMVLPIIWSILAIKAIRPTITQIIEALNNAINAKKEGVNIWDLKQSTTFEELSRQARRQDMVTFDDAELGQKDLTEFLQGVTIPMEEQRHSLPSRLRAGLDGGFNQVEIEDYSSNDPSIARGRIENYINNATRLLDDATTLFGPDHPTLSSQIRVARGLISALSGLGKPKVSSTFPGYGLKSATQTTVCPAQFADGGGYPQAFDAFKERSILGVRRDAQRSLDFFESKLCADSADVVSFLSAQGTSPQNRLQLPFLSPQTASAQWSLSETQHQATKLEPQRLRKRPAPPVPMKPEHLQISLPIRMIDLTEAMDSTPSCPEPLPRLDTTVGMYCNDVEEISVSERRKFFERDLQSSIQSA